jgi:hypothetical protein
MNQGFIKHFYGLWDYKTFVWIHSLGNTDYENNYVLNGIPIHFMNWMAKAHIMMNSEDTTLLLTEGLESKFLRM